MIRTLTYKPCYWDVVKELKICKREREELKAQSDISPKQALKDSLDSSIVAWLLLDESEKCIGAGGVARDPKDEKAGIVWVLCSDELFNKHLFSSNSFCYDGLAYCFFKLGLTRVYNYVSLKNKPSIKWLKSLGFSFDKEYVTFKDKETLFVKFHLDKGDF